MSVRFRLARGQNVPVEPTDIDDRLRILREVGDALTERFGDDLLVRIGPDYAPWSRAVALEAFAPNTAAAPAELILEESEAILLIGDAAACALIERRPMDVDVATWAIDRISAVGERGVEMWRDSRRSLFGGQHMARIVGEDFTDISDKRRARLSLSLTTEPWTVPASHDLEDPVPRAERRGTVFLVDHALPASLQGIATRVRQEFGSGVSVVTRMDALDRPQMLEILPSDPKATRMRIRAISSQSVGVATGIYQYLEYEFDTIGLDEAEEWIINVGRYGLLETTVSRGRLYWFVNAPATPEAITAAEANPRVAAEPVWHTWLP